MAGPRRDANDGNRKDFWELSFVDARLDSERGLIDSA